MSREAGVLLLTKLMVLKPFQCHEVQIGDDPCWTMVSSTASPRLVYAVISSGSQPYDLYVVLENSQKTKVSTARLQERV